LSTSIRLFLAPSNPREERERDLEHSIPPLVKLLGDSSSDVRAAAAQAIGDIEENPRKSTAEDSQLLPEIASKLAAILPLLRGTQLPTMPPLH